MVKDENIMGLCGETKIANKKTSWISMIQVFEYYISHHLTKAFESVFGGVTCLPGCFSMYSTSPYLFMSNKRNQSTQGSGRVFRAYSCESRCCVEISGEYCGYFAQEELVVAWRGQILVDFDVEDISSSETNLCSSGGLQNYCPGFVQCTSQSTTTMDQQYGTQSHGTFPGQGSLRNILFFHAGMSHHVS